MIIFDFLKHLDIKIFATASGFYYASPPKKISASVNTKPIKTDNMIGKNAPRIAPAQTQTRFFVKYPTEAAIIENGKVQIN